MKKSRMFKVLETSHFGGNWPDVHIFRNEAQFIEWMKKRLGPGEELNEFLDGWNTEGAVANTGSASWEPYDGLYEYDHTGE